MFLRKPRLRDVVVAVALHVLRHCSLFDDRTNAVVLSSGGGSEILDGGHLEVPPAIVAAFVL